MADGMIRHFQPPADRDACPQALDRSGGRGRPVSNELDSVEVSPISLMLLDFRGYAAASSQASRMALISSGVGSPGQGHGKVVNSGAVTSPMRAVRSVRR